MNQCKSCGEPLLAGSKFCGKCGTAVDAPLKQRCPKCKSEVPEGLTFCNKCGARLEANPAHPWVPPARSRTLVVTRETQFQCAGNSYKVVVNGNSLGNVSIGASVRTKIASDTATVEIICTTIMIHSKLHMLLKLGDNPKVSFKVQWPGGIHATVSDAQILEQHT